MHSKRLNIIKFEDVIAMLTLSIFLAEVNNIFHGIDNINFLSFNIVTTHLFEGF